MTIYPQSLCAIKRVAFVCFEIESAWCFSDTSGVVEEGEYDEDVRGLGVCGVGRE